MTKTILVTGATGKQGGAVVRQLLATETDVLILALTRDTGSRAAQSLALLSEKVKLVKGDLDQPDAVFESALATALGGIWGVFSVQAAIGTTPEEEEAQGKGLINASIRNGVKFFVYTSIDRGGDSQSSDNPTPVPHFISKFNIEKHLISMSKGTEMKWTILRPVAFIDFFKPGFFGRMAAALLRTNGSKPVQFILVKDIGYFAAQAFLNPDEYSGKAISLAGMQLTYEGASRIFKVRMGYNLPTSAAVVGTIAQMVSPNLKALWSWLREEGYAADIESLKEVYPNLCTDFGDYLENGSEFVKKTGK